MEFCALLPDFLEELDHDILTLKQSKKDVQDEEEQIRKLMEEAKLICFHTESKMEAKRRAEGKEKKGDKWAELFLSTLEEEKRLNI